MSSRPYMKFWIADYTADTMHLTGPQHGAYFLLLMAMWTSRDGWLPDDDQRLARVARTRIDRWKEMAPTIREFLVSEGGRVSQKRLLKELDASRCTGRKRTDAASARWASKPLENLNGHDANASNLQCKTYASHSHSHSHREEEEKSFAKKEAKPRPKPRTQIDPNWQIEPRHIARAAECGWDEEVARYQWARFLDYHQSHATLSASWNASWSTWISGPYVKDHRERAGLSSAPLTIEEKIRREPNAALRIVMQMELEEWRHKHERGPQDDRQNDLALPNLRCVN